VQLTKASRWPFIGLGALACLAFLIGASVLFEPWWAVTLLALGWLVLTATGSRWFATRPRAVVVLAVVGYLVWLASVALAALA
jgi:hypothetical protein